MSQHPLPQLEERDPPSPSHDSEHAVVIPIRRDVLPHFEEQEFHHRTSSHDDHDDDHIDERWLVSYSDMMTLLFGLFVMLYSLAMEHKGDINQALNEITENDTKQQGEKAQTKAELKKTITQLELRTQELEQRVVQTDIDRAEMEKLNQAHKTVSQQLESALAQVDQLSRASAGAANAAAAIRELQKTKSELQQRSQRLAQVEQQLDALRVQMQAQAQALEEGKNSRQTLQAQAARVASLEKENAAIKNQLNLAVKKLDQKDPKLAPQSGNFLLVILSWTTDRHDLDMVVTDPQGNSFNFDNRTFQKIPGEFVIDSRTGPGIEVFQAPNPMQGQYELKVDFYNAYGNKADAEVKVSFLTKLGERKIAPFKLNRANSRTKTFKFSLNAQGAIEGI